MGRNRKHIQAARAKQDSRTTTKLFKQLDTLLNTIHQMTQTHKELVKLADARVATRFSRFLADSDGSFLASLQFEVGNEWLDHAFTDSPASRANAAKCPLFWAWWRNQWAITDSRLNERMYVDTAGVLQYRVMEGHTHFIHCTDEFRTFYHEHHQMKAKYFIPAELATAWVVNSTKAE